MMSCVKLGQFFVVSILILQFVTITWAADTTPPSGHIITPTSGGDIKNTIRIEVAPQDNGGIQSVQILVDGNASFCSLEKHSPYTCDWNSQIVGDGTHILTATIIDLANNAFSTPSVSITVSNNTIATNLADSISTTSSGSSVNTNDGPSGHFTVPSNGARIKGLVPIDVTANASSGIKSVQIIIDRDSNFCSLERFSPYTCPWNSTDVEDGPHTLTARIVDLANNTFTTSSVAVTVQNKNIDTNDISGDTTVNSQGSVNTNDGPSGNFSVPTNGSSVKGVVPIDVFATASAGVVSVQITIDGNSSICSLERHIPYTCNWDTSNVGEGVHTLTATILDTANRAFTTSPISIDVNNSGATTGITDTDGNSGNPDNGLSGHVLTPGTGAQVNNLVHIDISASAPAGVANVQILIDDAVNHCSLEQHSPYTCDWNSTQVNNGPHTITATILDKANNSLTTPPVIVTVANGGDNFGSNPGGNVGSNSGDNSGGNPGGDVRSNPGGSALFSCDFEPNGQNCLTGKANNEINTFGEFGIPPLQGGGQYAITAKNRNSNSDSSNLDLYFRSHATQNLYGRIYVYFPASWRAGSNFANGLKFWGTTTHSSLTTCAECAWTTIWWKLAEQNGNLWIAPQHPREPTLSTGGRVPKPLTRGTWHYVEFHVQNNPNGVDVVETWIDADARSSAPTHRLAMELFPAKNDKFGTVAANPNWSAFVPSSVQQYYVDGFKTASKPIGDEYGLTK